jgi:hypothetical protein
MRKSAFLTGLLGLVLFLPAVVPAGHGPAESAPAWRPAAYDLELRIDYEKERLFGRCRLSAVNASAGSSSEIPLLLYRLMKVTAVRDENGRDVPFTQSVRSFEDWEAIQANAVILSLREAAPSGSKATFAIEYEGLLAGYSAEGMRYVKDHIDKEFTILRTDAFAYPQIGVPSWKINRAAGLPAFRYRLRVTVPESLAVANGGRLTGKTSAGGLTTYAYESLRPSWRIDAAAADYRIVEDPGRGFRVFCLPADEEGGRAVLEAMSKATALFAGWFGPPPGAPGFAVIEVPSGYGSQADETVILQTRDAFVDPEKRTELYHEISHRWSVGALDLLPPRFESEGAAMFLQFLAREKLEGRPGAAAQGALSIRERFRRQCAKDDRSRTTAMIDYGREDLTDQAYSKGMLFFYGLYRLAGEKEFLAALRTCFTDFRESGATARRFLDRLQAALGIPLDRYFKDWIYEGPPSSDLLIGDTSLEDVFARYRR